MWGRRQIPAARMGIAHISAGADDPVHPTRRHAAQNLGFGGVLSSLSFAVERKGAAGGMALISRRGAGETDCRTSDSVFYKGCQFRVDRRAVGPQ